MKRASSIILVVLMVIALAGCSNSNGTLTSAGADATFISNSYQTLDVVGKSVDTAMKSMALLYKAGQFSEESKARSVQAYDVFKIAYNNAVDALVLYATTPTPANKSAVTSSLADIGIQVAVIVALNIATAK